MVTLNILKLNGPLTIWISQSTGKHPIKKPKAYPHLGTGTRREDQEKNSRRREVGYYRKQNRRKFKTAGVVNLKLKKGSRRQEKRKDIRFGIKGVREFL